MFDEDTITLFDEDTYKTTGYKNISCINEDVCSLLSIGKLPL